MASRNYSRVQGLNKELKIIAGRVDGAGVVEAGLGFTAEVDGSDIKIKLDDKYSALISATATAGSGAVTIKSHDVKEAKEVVIEASVSAGEEVHFCLVLQNSSLPFK